MLLTKHISLALIPDAASYCAARVLYVPQTFQSSTLLILVRQLEGFQAYNHYAAIDDPSAVERDVEVFPVRIASYAATPAVASIRNCLSNLNAVRAHLGGIESYRTAATRKLSQIQGIMKEFEELAVRRAEEIGSSSSDGS